MNKVKPMKRKKKKNSGAVQGHALLYGRSSRAIRIVHGEIVGRGDDKSRSFKKKSGPEKLAVNNNLPSKKNSRKEKFVQKNYKMDEATKRKLDNLQDPLTLMSRFSRAQKYEASNSTEKYEYGLSDW